MTILYNQGTNLRSPISRTFSGLLRPISRTFSGRYSRHRIGKATTQNFQDFFINFQDFPGLFSASSISRTFQDFQDPVVCAGQTCTYKSYQPYPISCKPKKNAIVNHKQIFAIHSGGQANCFPIRPIFYQPDMARWQILSFIFYHIIKTWILEVQLYKTTSSEQKKISGKHICPMYSRVSSYVPG